MILLYTDSNKDTKGAPKVVYNFKNLLPHSKKKAYLKNSYTVYTVT